VADQSAISPFLGGGWRGSLVGPDEFVPKSIVHCSNCIAAHKEMFFPQSVCVLLCFIIPILGNRYGPGVNSLRQ